MRRGPRCETPARHQTIHTFTETTQIMANTYHQIYLQMIFAVRYRRSVIEKSWQNQLYGVIGNLINQTSCKTIIVNGVQDHVHCLVGLKPVVSVSQLMKEVKAKSSKYINDHS